MIIPLETVIVDDRARDGTWCTLPYPGHPNGCPNFPQCCESRPHFNEYQGFDWFAVVYKFDLKAWGDKREETHRRKYEEQNWFLDESDKPSYKPLSERQRRNVLYWQEHKVRKPLRVEAMTICFPLLGDILLDIPEANGVQVFDTMAKHGIVLEAQKPDIVQKIMFVGKRNSTVKETEK